MGQGTVRDKAGDKARDNGNHAVKDTGRDMGKDKGRGTGMDMGRDTGRDTGMDTGMDTERDTERDTVKANLGRRPLFLLNKLKSEKDVTPNVKTESQMHRENFYTRKTLYVDSSRPLFLQLNKMFRFPTTVSKEVSYQYKPFFNQSGISSICNNLR